MDMTITVPTAQIDDFINGILTQMPVPVDENGDPLYTDNQWAKLAIQKLIKNMFVAGRMKAFDNSNLSARDAEISSANTDFDLITFNFS